MTRALEPSLDQLKRLSAEQDPANSRPPLWDRTEQGILREGMRWLLEENQRLEDELNDAQALQSWCD